MAIGCFPDTHPAFHLLPLPFSHLPLAASGCLASLLSNALACAANARLSLLLLVDTPCTDL